MQKTLLIDLDGTIEDLLTPWVKLLNEKYSLDVNTSSIDHWDMDGDFSSLSKQQICEPLETAELWQQVKPMPEAVEVLQQLQSEGHHVYICTAATTPKEFFLKTDLFVKKYLPFFDIKRQCICIHDKWLLQGDLLLDDNINNLRKDASYRKLLFTQPYNVKENTKGITRINTWKEFYSFVKNL